MLKRAAEFSDCRIARTGWKPVPQKAHPWHGFSTRADDAELQMPATAKTGSPKRRRIRGAPWYHYGVTPALALVAALLLVADPAPSRDELKALDRDEAAAEAAADTGDVREALRYFDYFGHEHEAFATAVLKYGRAQRRLR